MSLDDLQAQLRSALDQQFAALKQQYERGIADARQQALLEAQRIAEGRIAQLREQMQAHVEQLVVNARAEAEQRAREAATAERQAFEQQLRQELDQQRAQAVTAARTEAEQRAREAAAAERNAFEQRLREDFEQERGKAVTAARADAEQRAREAAMAERQAFEQQLRQQLEQQRSEAVAAARADAEQRAREAATTERNAFERRLRSELDQQLLEAVAAARAETERETREAGTLQWQAAEQQIRRELEDHASQQVEQALGTARQAAEEEKESERRRAGDEIEAERARIRAELESQLLVARTEFDAERDQARTELAAEKQRARALAGSGGADVLGLSDALRDLDNSRTLTQALDVLVSQSGTIAGRSALFLINGDALRAWKSAGIPDDHVRAIEISLGDGGLLARAIQAGQGTWTSADLPAPPFARLPAEAEGFAVPVMIGGRAVAVLYVDGAGRAAAFDLVEALARHASTVVALRTAMRTLDVLRGVPTDLAGNGHDLGENDAARRFAKLLVSEIKLYNEGAIRAGRQQRDLLQRLGAEIERARRLYEERVPATVGARHVYFQQELVQTLADGDPALLGTR